MSGGTTMPLVNWGATQGGTAAGNPLSLVDQAMKVRQAGQEFQARQRFGQIMSGSGGDIDEALKQAQADPMVGAFAPQLMSELRQQQLLGSQTEAQRLGIGKSAREGLASVLQTVDDPTKLGAVLQSQFGTYDRRTQELSKPYGESIMTSLTAGLPADATAARTEFNRRKALMMVSTGMLPNVATAAGAAGFGVPSVVDVQGQPTGVVQDPFSGQVRVGGGNALTPGGGPPASVPGIALPTPGGGTSAPTPATAPAPAPSPAGTPVSSVDNQPIYDPTVKYPVPYTFGTGGTGAPILSSSMENAAKELGSKHEGVDLDAYRAAQQTRASLVQMDAAYDNLIKDGGFLQPGTMARARTMAAGAVNTISQLFGKETYFDPSKVASAEQFNKETERMALQVTRQFLGGQHEAAQTINRIATSVPSIENSYLGGKLIIAGIRASNQRLMDERMFNNAWLADPTHGGNLLGAAEAFNSRAPAESYANKELDSFGLKPDGKFKAPEAVGEMVRRGLMTPKQGHDVLKSQFGFGD